MPSKLAETTNLLALHQHAVGRSEVPPAYHLWAMLSAIAAAVSDRVWTPFQGDRLVPNLFTLLIGDAASGKGTAINRVCDYLPSGLAREGPLTGQGLMKLLARESKRNGGARAYLVMEELLHCVGLGKQAIDFISTLTGMWMASKRDTVKETVTGGRLTIQGGHCVNFFGATTRKWLTEVLRPGDLTAGPGRRFCAVEVERDLELRIAEVEFPPDRAEVVNFLMQVFVHLTQVEGEITKTAQARAIEQAWYMTRVAPKSADELSLWRQVHANANKLAMLCAIADGVGLGIDMEGGVRMSHMTRGIALAESAFQAMCKLLDVASGTRETDNLNRVRRIICRHGVIERGKAMRASSLTHRDFETCVRTLVYLREVDVKRVPNAKDLSKKETVLMWAPEDDE